MKTLIRAGCLYPVTSPPIIDGWMMIEDGTIKALGKAGDTLPEHSAIIDFSKNLVMPGFINIHSHLQLSGLKGNIHWNGSILSWISDVIQHNISSCENRKKAAIEDGLRQMQESGITAVADIISTATLASVGLNCGIKYIPFIESINPLNDGAEQEAKRVEQELQKILATGKPVGISPHGSHTVSPKLFHLLANMAKQLQLPLTTHIAETEEELQHISSGTGEISEMLKQQRGLPDDFDGYKTSPAKLVASSGALQKNIIVHLNHLPVEEIPLLKKHNATPVFCPTSSRWFGRQKVLPLLEMLDAGLKPAIGTDSLASSHTLSMTEQLREAKRYFPSIPTETVIEMATINPAKALQLNCGELKPERDADLAIWQMNGKNPAEVILNSKKVLNLLCRPIGGCSNR